MKDQAPFFKDHTWCSMQVIVNSCVKKGILHINPAILEFFKLKHRTGLNQISNPGPGLIKPSMEVVIALFPNAISLSFNRQDGRYFFLNRSSIEKICLNDEIWIVEVIFSHKYKRWQPASLFPDLCKMINLLHVFF